ncbi:MAG TPA: AraC family transcriptional regulator [Candidatus Polarisedimenticolaceae bacterium]|nr:AraC family transcriptional regulator [Candidatus Polarisedimenticolaceae bacterium]
MSGTATPTLSYGEIYGEISARHETAGFVISAARAVVPPEEIPVHTHPEGSFTFILSGFQISGARHAVDGGFGPGSLVYNPPGTTHRDRLRSTRDGRCLSISIPPHVSDAIPLPATPTGIASHEALGFVRAITRESAAWDACSPILAESLCLELVGTAANPDTMRRESTVPRWLTRAQELLTDRCAEPLSIRAVAQDVGVHPAHLARTFARFFKRSPGEHLRRSRVARAAAQLRETDLSLAEIALSCGFADQSHFTNVFRRYKALAPAAFRRAFRVARPRRGVCKILTRTVAR